MPRHVTLSPIGAVSCGKAKSHSGSVSIRRCWFCIHTATGALCSKFGSNASGRPQTLSATRLSLRRASGASISTQSASSMPLWCVPMVGSRLSLAYIMAEKTQNGSGSSSQKRPSRCAG